MLFSLLSVAFGARFIRFVVSLLGHYLYSALTLEHILADRWRRADGSAHPVLCGFFVRLDLGIGLHIRIFRRLRLRVISFFCHLYRVLRVSRPNMNT
jgi:hypothetical protein